MNFVQRLNKVTGSQQTTLVEHHVCLRYRYTSVKLKYIDSRMKCWTKLKCQEAYIDNFNNSFIGPTFQHS